jgi:DNA repair exonuclease SbcCD ATPase subunit
MRIQKLVLKNFRSHKDTALELERYNFIRGPNASGKSSIQIALQYLLTGRCATTDAAGRGAENLIHSGEKELEVSVTLVGGRTICRRRTGKSQNIEIDGRKAPIDVAEALLSQSIGTADLLSAVLNVDRFVKMSAADQQRLLAQLVPANAELPPEIRDALDALNERGPELRDVAAIEAAHKRYRDLAIDVARALDALGQVAEPASTPELPAASEVERKIQELRREKELLLARRNNEAARCWQTAQPASMVHQEPLALDQDRHVQIRSEFAQLSMKQKSIEIAFTALEEATDSCPTCGQAVAAEVKAQLLATLGERRGEIEVLIQGAREELSDCEASFQLDDANSKAGTEERPTLPLAAGFAADGLEGRLTVLTERISKAERVLEKVRQNQSARETWEAHVRERARLESRHLLFEKLSSSFGPNGLAVQTARDEIRLLSERVNQHLAAFGYVCRVSFEPYEIRVSSPKNAAHELSLRQLSESEQFRFGIALQVAVAMATGVGFVVIDRADALDTENRRMLTGLLMISGLDQAIILATGDDAPPATLPEGVKFLDLTKLANFSESGDAELTRRRPSCPTSEAAIECRRMA